MTTRAPERATPPGSALTTAPHPYVPGEQPQEEGWVKLNTNENPYLLPQVVQAVAEAAGDALQCYPDPVCTALRAGLSARYGVPPRPSSCVATGRTSCGPWPSASSPGRGDRIAYPDPSYSLYETLARIQNVFPFRCPGPSWSSRWRTWRPGALDARRQP